jgi:cytochrome c oxidase assembly factor CtaG
MTCVGACGTMPTMHRLPRQPSLARAVALAVPVLAMWGVGIALAHGPVPDQPPDPVGLALGWSFEPLPTLAIAIATGWWIWAVRNVDAAHPANPVPRRRSLAFGLGMLALAVALLSGIDAYDTTLFSIHMVQHVLLMLIAAPLIALSAPITLLLRVSAPETRKRWILPVLHSRVVRVLAFPVVTWIIFATVMWGSHFSALFDAALEDPLLHVVEHGIYLGAAFLFWWPAVALDPAPWRMPHPVRMLYLFLQMPQNTFLAVVILGASAPLYEHYATLVRAWGPTPLADQQLAAGIMWIVGDLVFMVAILGVLVGWMRAEARDAGRADRRAATELEVIRGNERRLADRLAREREDAQSGSGVAR